MIRTGGRDEASNRFFKCSSVNDGTFRHDICCSTHFRRFEVAFLGLECNILSDLVNLALKKGCNSLHLVVVASSGASSKGGFLNFSNTEESTRALIVFEKKDHLALYISELYLQRVLFFAISFLFSCSLSLGFLQSLLKCLHRFSSMGTPLYVYVFWF